MHQVIYPESPPFSVKTERLHRRVEADSVPELEAVGECLLGGVDAHTDAVQLVDFNAFRERLAREALGPERRMVQARLLRTACQR